MSRRTLDAALLVVGLLATLSGCARAEEQPDRRPGAKELADKVVKMYGGIAAYQDAGVVEVAMNQGTIKHRSTQTFSIAFKRPGRFRFEWTGTMAGGQKDYHVLSCDGQETYSYWEYLQQYKHDPDLTMAIAAATGVSSGAVHTIPGLLLDTKAWGTSGLSVLSDSVLLPDETFEDVSCYVVAGQLPGYSKCRYWIGRDDHLIRKIETVMAFSEEAVGMATDGLKKVDATGEAAKALERMKDTHVLTREIHRDIKINKRIPNESFRFEPPEGTRLVEEFEVGM